MVVFIVSYTVNLPPRATAGPNPQYNVQSLANTAATTSASKYESFLSIKINQHNFTGIDNSMAYPADVVIASGAYMVRHRSRRRLVLRGCIPRYDLGL